MNENANNKADLGPNGRKLQPKLRMFCDGDSEVNANRAAQSASLAVASEKLLIETAPVAFDNFAMTATADFSEPIPVPEPPPLETIPDDVLVNVFVETVDVNDQIEIEDSVEDVPGADSEDARRRETGVTARRGNIATATVRLSQVGSVSQFMLTKIMVMNIHFYHRVVHFFAL